MQWPGTPPPTILASASSVVIVMAVLVAVAIAAVSVIAGSYLPYRRRHSHHRVETADFKFIDLNDPSFLPKVWRWLRGRGRMERIGLVNFGSVPPESSLLYGSQSDSLAAYRVAQGE